MSASDVVINTIEEIAQKQSSFIKDLARHFFHDDDIADDVLQEVLLKVDKLLPKSFASEAKLLAWLSQVTKNYCKDVYRKNSHYQAMQTRHSQALGSNTEAKSVETQLEIQRVSDFIHGVIDQFSPEEQEIYKMYAFSDYTLQEIQKKSGKKLRFVRYTIERVNKELFLSAKKQGIKPY